MTSFDPSPKSILVYVGLDLIGDGLMKLPFVRALRAAFPQARITWLAGKGKTVYAGKLKGLVQGLLDEVIEEAEIGTNWRELLRRPLSGRRFDLVIDTQRRVLTTLILRRIEHRTFVSGSAGYLFSDIKPLAGRQKASSMMGQMLALLELASGKPAEISGTIHLDEGVLKEAERALPSSKVYVGLAPGAGGKHKCWPLEYFIALSKQLDGAGHVPVFFLGPDEAGWRGELETAVPQALFPLQDNKKYGVAPDFTIALAKRCACTIAGDCGQGHMFAAADAPLVSLFGPTSPEKFAPVTRELTILRAQDFSEKSDMSEIPLTAVAQAADNYITNS